MDLIKNMVSQKTILISGGAGFIGSHLCDALVKKNTVICMDNLITGSADNINHLLKNRNFIFINHDITEPYTEKFSRLDEIYDLASPASPKDFAKIPLEIMRVNSIGLYNLLCLAREYKAKLLYASTSEVYGDPKMSPQKETYWGNVNPNGPRSCYDESKRFGESLALVFKVQYNVKVKIVRIFNTYGPRMRPDDGRVIPNFINQALTDKNISVYGKGEQTRSFCYVSDMVDGLIKLMASRETGPVNIGNPQENTILKIAEKITEMIGSKSKMSYENLPPDDPRQRKPDITLAKEKLGWKPKVSLEKGLNETIEYFKKLSNNFELRNK